MKQASPLRSTQVMPTTQVPPPAALFTQDETWTYDLEPSHAMPRLDLKRTLQTEFCSAAMARVLYRISRYPSALFLAYLVTVASYMAVMVAPAHIGRYVAMIGLIAGLPGILLSLAQLRYDIIKLLVRTFDVWFASVMWALVFTVLAFMLDDFRALMALSLWVGSWPNAFHDACLVAIRSVVVINVMCIFVSLTIVLAINFRIADHVKDFEFFRYRDHFVLARSVITDGFINIMAIMARNAFRRRDFLFSRHATSNELECIIYRCQLRLVHRHCHRIVTTAPQESHESPGTLSTPTAATVSHIQSMRSVGFDQVDLRDTIVRTAWTQITSTTSSRPLHYRVLTGSSFMCTAGACVLVMVGAGASSLHLHNGLVAAACTLTVLHSLTTAALYQRQLLVMICTSFDFVFFIVQVDFVAIVVCDLFSWRLHTVLLTVTVLLWIHWVMLLDALTPLVRQRLHIHRYFPRLVFACCFSAGIALVYSLIFANPPAPVYDRVLWSGTVLGHAVSFRLLPQFYSSLATVFFLSLRFGWRQCWLDEDELVVIDGPVKFTNPFHRFKRSKLAPRPVLTAHP